MVNILSKSQSSARSHEIQLSLYSVCYKFWKLQMRQNLNIMEIFTLENKIGKQGTIPKKFRSSGEPSLLQKYPDLRTPESLVFFSF